MSFPFKKLYILQFLPLLFLRYRTQKNVKAIAGTSKTKINHKLKPLVCWGTRDGFHSKIKRERESQISQKMAAKIQKFYVKPKDYFQYHCAFFKDETLDCKNEKVHWGGGSLSRRMWQISDPSANTSNVFWLWNRITSLHRQTGRAAPSTPLLFWLIWDEEEVWGGYRMFC